MKRNVAFGLIAIIFLGSCNNEENNSGLTPDSTNTVQNNKAASSPMDGSGSANSTSADTSLKEVMDKMMQGMHTMKMTGDPDHDFATMMKKHHEGAIAMSNMEIANGANAELKQIARKIIDDSQKDISELNSFLGSHQPGTKSDYSKKTMDKMMGKMMGKSSGMNMDHGGNMDQQFAMMMTMHHQHGIEMARDYLKSATEEQTKKVANNSINANTEDIKKLKNWQKNN